jgi:hypothetical protein
LLWDQKFADTIKSFIFPHNLEEEDPLQSNPETFPDILATEGCYAGEGWSIVKHCFSSCQKLRLVDTEYRKDNISGVC